MEKNKMMLFAVAAVLVLVVAAFALTNNQGTSDTNTEGENNEGNGNTNPEGDGEGLPDTNANAQGSIVGNWTFFDGTTNGEPVTHIVSGWINYKADGTWTYFYDYGYTTVNAQGTWQAQDGQLNWGTDGSEISDWYSVDTYQIVDGDLVITSGTSEMRYRKN